MSVCKHENRTIDCVCNDCGYDLIVEPPLEKASQQERERIADYLRDLAADLVADGDMASSELVLLTRLIDWLEGENK